MKKDNFEEIFKRCDDFIDQNHFAGRSFVKMVLDGEVNKESLKGWAIQKFFQVRDQNCVFSAIHSNSKHFLDIREFQMSQLIDEETEMGEGSAAHYALMERFARALGAKDSDFSIDKIGTGVKRFVNYLLTLCQREHPVYGMLAIYVNEKQTPRAADLLHKYLKSNFNLDDDELEWFTVHAEADIKHSSMGRELISRYFEKLPDFNDKSLQIVKNGVNEWHCLHEYYASIIHDH